MALSSFALRCRALPAQGWRQRASVSLEPGRLRFGPALRSDAARLAHAGARGVAAAYQPSDASPGTDASAQAQNSGLSTLELFQEAQISRLTGACYHEWEDLRQAVRREKFEVVAGGDTYFTRWYIAQGTLTGGPESAGSGDAEQQSGEPVTLVISRGVMWRNADVDSLRVWQQLSQSWPAPFMHDQVGRMPGGGVVQVHTGIDSMATELLAAIEPHLRNLGGPISFAGHSLGGSLSKVLAARLVASGHRRGADVFVHTFGSPPAFSCSCGGHGSRIMQHLRIPPSHLRNWVLDYDPVPRAMISADPYYQLALKNSTLRNVLQFGEWVLGPNAPSPRKFLYRNVGEVFLLSVAKPSEAVTPLSEETLEKTLEMPLDDFVSRPALLLQTLLDHVHWSYSNDLMAAARLQQKREQRQAQLAQPQSNGVERLRASELAVDGGSDRNGGAESSTRIGSFQASGPQSASVMSAGGQTRQAI